jgi:hypothetical protein
MYQKYKASRTNQLLEEIVLYSERYELQITQLRKRNRKHKYKRMRNESKKLEESTKAI